MRTTLIAASFAVAALALPIAAQAASNCGVPQGYGTTNPYTFNRSTCGNGDNSYNVPNAAKQTEVVTGSGTESGPPAGYGTTNPYIPNSGAPHLGSNTDGP